MPNLVFILGAGASAEGGCPVMSNFFSAANTLSQHGLLGEYQADFDAVDMFRKLLLRSKIHSNLDLENLESVFNALEMADFLEQGDTGPLRIGTTTLRSSFVRLIAAVLERTQAMRPTTTQQPIFGDSSVPQPPGPVPVVVGPKGYDELCRLIGAMTTNAPPYSVTFITFNYDVGLEYALSQRAMPFHYGLDDNAQDGIPVYKLHGSTNWFAGADGTLHVVQPHGRLQQAPAVWPPGPGKPTPGNFLLISDLLSTKASYIGAPAQPFIIPPTEAKQRNRAQLGGIWRAASKSISEADFIVVVGYSIPNTDEFFRQFYSLSMMENDRIERFFVCDTSWSSIAARYTDLLGPVLGRKLQSYSGCFTDFVSFLHNRTRNQVGLL